MSRKERIDLEKKIVVRAENLGVKYNLNEQKVDDFKDYIIKAVKGELNYNEFWALKNVSFTIEAGDHVGILGLNGAGKSTLLKTIAGVLKPTEGKVMTKGKVVPLLELGAGFDRQYTGAENIYLYGAVLGYSRKFINSKFDEIVEFSELEDFINVPVKNYSSGMKSRLGFAIATTMHADILILDEVLAVGDAKFRKKCEGRIKEMFADGTTVLFVSHNLSQVKKLCDKALLMEHGRVAAYGDTERIARIYERRMEMY